MEPRLKSRSQVFEQRIRANIEGSLTEFQEIFLFEFNMDNLGHRIRILSIRAIGFVTLECIRFHEISNSANMCFRRT